MASRPEGVATVRDDCPDHNIRGRPVEVLEDLEAATGIKDPWSQTAETWPHRIYMKMNPPLGGKVWCGHFSREGKDAERCFVHESWLKE
jgi:hypothetical protein